MYIFETLHLSPQERSTFDPILSVFSKMILLKFFGRWREAKIPLAQPPIITIS